MRRAGILMPITSLPSPYGVGTLGQAARDFIDFLKKAGQTYWQILPICPTGYGDSPYQSFSSFAGNPYMIDLDDLAKEGLLEPSEYKDIKWSEDDSHVDYGILYQNRYNVLKKAVLRVKGEVFDSFCNEQNEWLEDYALYMAIKNYFGGQAFNTWPEDYRLRSPEALEKMKEECKEDIHYWKALQFLFFSQWKKLKTYANDAGIQVIGDIPIYVSYDSADVWSNPDQFQLDESLTPKAIAGCPPDGFAADGQLWGNPLFDWEKMKEEDYSWWIRRIAYQVKIYDIIRIDHFRGFDEYFAIPYGDKTAKNGSWMPGPGISLFKAIEEKLGKLPIIAEDLGFLTPTVKQLLADTGFPGMKILQFGFDTRDTGDGYLPHCYPKNCVAYTGTHDNQTVLGWIETAPKEDVEKGIKYLRLTKEEGYHWGMMRTVWGCVADTSIIPMQDILGLGSEARLNAPSTLGNNWTWRCLPGDYNDELAKVLYEEMCLYERI
ncbi:4-alpha-glucanotransferase (amylomaltase) [Lachnospiraceae bacterium TWA4]|nr:4-alpha-glucanotransferase (amylomaltase) [Lachnospiraceae bacterium TWA4]